MKRKTLKILLGIALAIPLSLVLMYIYADCSGELQYISHHATGPSSYCPVNPFKINKHNDQTKKKLRSLVKTFRRFSTKCIPSQKELNLPYSLSDITKLKAAGCGHIINLNIAQRANSPFIPFNYDYQNYKYAKDSFYRDMEIGYFPKEKLWKARSHGYFKSLSYDDIVIEFKPGGEIVSE